MEGGGAGGGFAGWPAAVQTAARLATDQTADGDPLSPEHIRERAAEFWPAADLAHADAGVLADFALYCLRDRWLLQRSAARLSRGGDELRRALPARVDQLRAALIYARSVAVQLAEMPGEAAAHATAGAVAELRAGALSPPTNRALLRVVPAAAPAAADGPWAFAHASLRPHLCLRAAADAGAGDPNSLEPYLQGLVPGGDGGRPHFADAARRAAEGGSLRGCLHRCARLGAAGLAAACAADGAAAAARNEFGQTPLHVAGSPGVVAWLVAELKKGGGDGDGGGVDARDHGGSTPLAAACTAGLVEVAVALLGARADPDARTEQGVTPVMFAAMGGASEAERKPLLAAEHAECVAALARHGASLELKGPQNMTALCFAALHGHGGALDALLAAGADPRAANDEGCTPLHFACFRGDAAACRALLQHGANPQTPDKMGRTPKELAVACGNQDSGHAEAAAVLDARQPFALGQGSIKAPSDVYQPGCIVEAHGLKSAAGQAVNGKRGVVIGPEGDRVGVRFPPPLGSRAVRAENLKVVSSADDAAAEPAEA